MFHILPLLPALLVGFAGVSSLVFAADSSAALPPDAQEMLKSFPGQKLSLDTVVGRAIQASESFKAVASQKIAAESPLLQADAITDPRVYARFSRSLSRLEPTNPFATTRASLASVTAGAQKLFSTGTALQFEVIHGYQDLTFPFQSIPLNYETRGTLMLTQNLWADGFGSATRAAIDSGRFATEAARAGFDEAVEAWVLDLMQLYYSAWLSQAQAEASAVSLKRRKRLLEITQIKLKRGNAERPDLLQIQGANSNSEIQLDQSVQSLGDVWRNLVTSLKLPTSWIRIDPREIPLVLDDPVEAATSACGKPGQLSEPPQETAATRRAVLQFESARKAAERAKSEARPDLELALGVQSNGVDLRGNPTFGEVFRMDHPAYQLGVNFTMPLGFSAEKARAVSAAADAVRSEAQSSLEREGLPTLWMNLCLDLFRNQRAFELNRTSQEQQALRANLEEERFKIGRSSMLMVIQAGDDATLAELALKRSEVERRLAAWRVRRLTGGLQKYVEKLLAAGGAP